MRPRRRLPAALAVVALLLQALVTFAPARAERVVICGAAGPVVVLLDLATRQPLPQPDKHGCCAVCVHCASCPVVLAPVGRGVFAIAPALALPPQARTMADEGALSTPVRVRGPPGAPDG